MYDIMVRIGLLYVLCILVGLSTGCSGSTGWRVSFGVSPVKQIDDRQQLNQEAAVVRR